MRRNETPGRIVTNFCTGVEVHDVITSANFYDCRLWGLSVVEVKFWVSPLTCVVALTTLSHYRASVWFFQCMPLFHKEYLRNSTVQKRHSYNGILITTYTRPTERCNFQRHWVTLQNFQWQGTSHGLSTTAELRLLHWQTCRIIEHGYNDFLQWCTSPCPVKVS